MFSLNFPKEFFDFIILADVLPGHDFKSEKGSKEMINHIKNFLKDDGIILLSTPNGNNAYFSKKNKITIDRIKELLSEFNYELYGYNPFPIQLDRILKFIPFWRDFLEFLMEKKIGFKNSVGLFAIIKKA
jgi:SAM-dependent methyltransferase